MLSLNVSENKGRFFLSRQVSGHIILENFHNPVLRKISLHADGCPGFHYLDNAGRKLTEILLFSSSAAAAGMYYYAQMSCLISYFWTRESNNVNFKQKPSLFLMISNFTMCSFQVVNLFICSQYFRYFLCIPEFKFETVLSVCIHFCNGVHVTLRGQFIGIITI